MSRKKKSEMSAGEKAAETRRKTFDNATPGQKAAITRKRRQAAKKAWETRRMQERDRLGGRRISK